MAKRKLEPQSFYAEQLTKAMLAQPDAVQRAFARAVGQTPEQRREYYAEKVGQLSGTLEATDLWDHQKQDIRNALKHIDDEANDPTAITVIPTGGGKTRIFQEETNALALPVKVNEKTVKVTPRIVQLFPTNQLIRQTKKKYAESFPGLQVGEANGRKIDIKPITLMTYDLFEQWSSEGKIKPGDIDMLVMDEAHRGLSDSRQDAIKPFLKSCPVRAFTATPIFDTEKNVYTLLGQENEVSRFTYDELIAAGHIAPIVNPVLKIRIKGKLPEDAQERQTLLRGLFEQELLDFYLHFKDEKTGERLFGRSFVGYVNTIERAKQMAEYFEEGLQAALADDASLQTLLQSKPAHLSEHISGQNSTKEQDALIERMKAGKTLGVFNDQWMVEGTDIQNLGATLRAPTSSLVVEVQSGGRAGRINPAWPKDDPRQTSFVTDVCFELNGKIIGKPRFFFEAINAPSLARVIQTPVIDIDAEEVGAGGKGRKKTKRKAEDYEVIDPSVAVNHLLKLRDERQYPIKTEGWLSDHNVSEMRMGNSLKTQAARKALVHKFLEEEGELLDSGIRKIEHNGHFIRMQRMITGNNSPSICYLGKDLVEAGLVIEGKLPDKTDEWVSHTDALSEAGGAAAHSIETRLELIEKFKAQEEKTPQKNVLEIKHKDHMYRMQRMQYGPAPVVCFWKEDLIAGGLIRAEKYPPKTEEWWSNQDILSKQGGSTDTSIETRRVLIQKFEDGKGKDLGNGILRVKHNKTYRMRWMQAGTMATICIAKDDALAGELVSAYPAKTKEWCSDSEALEKPDGGTAPSIKARKTLTERYEAGEGKPLEGGMRLIEYDGRRFHVQQMQSATQTPICFMVKELLDAGLIRQEKYPPITNEWAAGLGVSKMPAGKTITAKAAIEQLSTAFKARENAGTIGIQPIPYDKHTIRVQRMQSGVWSAVCYNKEDLIKANIVREKPYPRKTIDWWGDDEARQKPGGASTKSVEARRNLLERFRAGEGDLLADGVRQLEYEGHFIRMQYMLAGVQSTICFNSEDLVAAGLNSNGREMLKKPPIEKVSIIPGSKNLERKGVRRSVADDPS